MYYRAVGELPAKRHTQFRDETGRLRHEELIGAEGFSAESSLLYHRHPPTAVVAARPWELHEVGVAADVLLPRHLVPGELFDDGAGTDVVRDRRTLLANADVAIGYVAANQPSPLYKNAIGDELAFVEDGAATFESSLGTLEVGPGDYLRIPTAMIHRWVPTGDRPLRLLIVEARSAIRPPKRYLSSGGQFLESAPYCERDLRGPAGPLLVDDTEVDVYIRHRRAGAGSAVAGTVHTLRHHPFDVVGWDGCQYPYAINVADFEPITGRIHQPPPVHQIFEGSGFVVCNFVPRRVDYHPQAIPVPYAHSNVDSDEVLFYVAGNYEARKGSGIAAGSISYHPAGHVHGPHPDAIEPSIGVEAFDELAVMIDSFAPLVLTDAAHQCERAGYAYTWAAST